MIYRGRPGNRVYAIKEDSLKRRSEMPAPWSFVKWPEITQDVLGCPMPPEVKVAHIHPLSQDLLGALDRL